MKILMRAVNVLAHLLVYGSIAMLFWIFVAHLVESLWDLAFRTLA